MSNGDVRSKYSLGEGYVNWNAKAILDKQFIDDLIDPLLNFTIETIQVSKCRYYYGGKALKVVVPLSGGIDSALVTYISASAMERGIENGLTDVDLLCPFVPDLNEEDRYYRDLVLKSLHDKYPNVSVRTAECEVKPLVSGLESHVSNLLADFKLASVYSGEPRTRMLFTSMIDFADRIGYCFIGATNATEWALGEFSTGNSVDYSPIVDLYKTHVFMLAKKLGVPKEVIERLPTNTEYQTSKAHAYLQPPSNMSALDLFRVIDPIVHGLYFMRLSPEAIADKLGHSLEVIEKLSGRILYQEERRFPPFFSLADQEFPIKSLLKKDARTKLNKDFYYSIKK